MSSLHLRRRQFLSATAAGTAAVAMSSSLRAFASVPPETIRIGQSAVFSGLSADLGNEVRDGITAHFAEVNRGGGVLGQKLELVQRDDGYEPDRAAANTLELLDKEKCFALLGYVGTPTSGAALPIVTERGIPFVGAYTGALSLRTPFNRQVFNIRASYNDEMGPLIRAFTPFGYEKVAILYQNDGYGVSVRDAAIAALKAKNLQPVAMATVERNSIDVAKAVQTILKSGATHVVMGVAYSAAAAFIKQVRAASGYLNYASASFIDTTSLIDKVGADARGISINQVMPVPSTSALPVVMEYQSAMKTNGVSRWSYASLEGYIGAKTMVEGLRRAGPSPTRERLIASLETMHNYDVGGFAINFSPTNHNGSQFTELTTIGANGAILHG
jgi:ABC-type branched-subunit amino acid transport system substrate-binding protein